MSSSEAPGPGVIHDIGYRGYTGPRLDRRAITFALFTHTLRGVFGLGRAARSKVVPFGMATVMLLPAVVLAAVSVVGARQGLTEPVLPYTRFAMVTQGALAIFLAVAAPQAVSLDLRYHTLPLYLSRPLARADYALAKLAAVAAAVFILLAAPLLLMYLGALAAQFDAGEQTAQVLQALAGAALFALVLASIATVIASLTGRRGFGIASVITVLTLSFAVVSGLQDVAAVQAGDPTLAGWLGMLSPMTLVDGVQVWAFGADASTAAGPPDGVAGAVFLLAALLVVAASYAALLRRYRKVKA
ncbi:ABC transporter permease [Xylanimonas ulmi]|uniref:ABC-2 type transport system permease protein n=1 Tax=Xylanimonas ulmi TaxID=228973 RepID=A0A4Q7LZX6_9MICO|nr:ABC transporter permease [Xylanibacterium ulmi]RZS60401.1 ABC-2 type transport system permease protein [Xylanibacterium ulmi]